MKIEEIIELCKTEDRSAQQRLYKQYSPMLFSICLRYIKQRDLAEDALLEGMYKILTKIKFYEGKGSFEGWMKRIVVNECLMKLRKKSNFSMAIEISNIEIKDYVGVEDALAYDDLIKMMNTLPTGYRTIFNLYVVEGYKHKEIAELLGISINTSKSQLILARRRLQSMIKKKSDRIAN